MKQHLGIPAKFMHEHLRIDGINKPYIWQIIQTTVNTIMQDTLPSLYKKVHMINYNAEGMAVTHTQKEESLNSSHPKLSLYPFFTAFFFCWGGGGVWLWWWSCNEPQAN